MQYLCDADNSIGCLSKYNLVRNIFFKYNCAVPSSAPVERLFRFAGMILNPKRSNLGDSRFEHCTLLYANKHKF